MKLGLMTTWKDKCGIAENSEMLVNELRRKGIEVTIFAEGVDWNRHKQFDSLLNKINNSDIDVFHAMYEMYLCGFGGDQRFPLLLSKIKVPRVVEFHNWITTSPPKNFEAEAYLTRGIPMTRAAETVFGDRVYQTTFGTEIFEDIHQTQKPIRQAGSILIATHGFLGADKGMDGLMNVLIRLNKIGIFARLQFIGGLQPNSPYRQFVMGLLRKVKTAGFLENVYTTNFLTTTKEIQEVASSSDVMVFNYNDIMTQGVFVSSASVYRVLPTGVPIIGTHENRLEDLIEKQALFGIPQNNENSLVDAIIKITSDNALARRLGESARAYSRTITWDKVADKTIKIYEEVI